MKMPACWVSLGAATLMLPTVALRAQEYPSKAVRIVASEAGGGGDFIARLLAVGLTPILGQQVVVENRGGGVVAGDEVARSAPDGHTLLLYGNTLWLLPLMRKQVPYDPHRDFAPVTLAGRAGNVLVVHPSLPVKSVNELIALARARPGELNFSTAAPGTINHLAGELFKSMAQLNIVRVSYRGSPAIKAVLEDVCDNLFNPDPYLQQGGDMVRVGGMNYICEPNAGIGKRITGLHLAGKPMDADKRYKVAGWAPVGEGVTGEPVWDVVEKYLKDHKRIKPRAPNVPRLVGVERNQGFGV